MCRSCILVLLVAVLAVTADQEPVRKAHYRQGRGVEAGTEDNTASLNRSNYTPRQPQDVTTGLQGELKDEKDQDEIKVSTNRPTMRYTNQQQRRNQVVEDQSEDSDTEASSSYNTMVHPAEQRTNNVRYKTILVKKLKNQPRRYNPNAQNPEQHYNSHQNSENYNQYQNAQSDPPPPRSLPQDDSSGKSVQDDRLARAIHPSIMENLMKQQPQTFDNPQEKESDVSEEESPTWQDQRFHNENSPRQSYKPYKMHFTLKNNAENQRDSYDINKRPIYVPNRVSIQNPSSDSSFNVGYSIGFGNAIAQPLKSGVVDPPVGLRQSKKISHPTSYQNTPVNVHIDGQKTYWKNMGSGVEMSHKIETKPYYRSNVDEPNRNYPDDHTSYSSGSVVNQPLYFKEDFDHSFSSGLSSGPNSFDHNHALQQSNTFDFSNAINPATNLPYSSGVKFNQIPKQSHFVYSTESFSNPSALTSYSESKPYHSHYLDTFTKPHHPSFSEQHDEPSNQHSSSQTHQTTITSNDGQSSEGSKYERPQYEKPSLQYNSLRSGHSVNFSPRPRTTEFHKNIPANSQAKYIIKPVSSNNINHINEDIYGGNFGFQTLPVVPHMFPTDTKSAPGGMVQAILVPVNAPSSSFSYSMGMPIPNGYSPYFGHPIGMLRIPESLAASSPIPVAQGPNFDPSGTVEPQIYHPTYHRSPPTKLVHSHSMTVNHHKEHPAESTQYFFQRTPHQTSLRTEEPSDQPVQHRYKTVFSAESSNYTPAGVKYASSTPSHSSAPLYASMSSDAQPSSSFFSHPTRLHRPGSMVIVKRA